MLYAGVDFVRNCGLPHIGFCTIHVYPGDYLHALQPLPYLQRHLGLRIVRQACNQACLLPAHHTCTGILMRTSYCICQTTD